MMLMCVCYCHGVQLRCVLFGGGEQKGQNTLDAKKAIDGIRDENSV